MSELAPPLTDTERADARLSGITAALRQVTVIQSQVRLQLAALALEDTEFGHRRYVADELALALAESPGTAQRLLEQAQMYADFPAVIARVGLPAGEGGWSLRHADAVIDSLSGVGLSRDQQQQAVDLVLAARDACTPYELRKATQAAVIVVDPEAAARRFDKAKRNRRVGGDSFGDGGAGFFANGTTSQIAMVLASIDALAGPKQPGDDRNLEQRRFDAFMDLICGRALPAQWQALVVVTLATLEGTSEEPAEIPGLGLVSAQEAREVLAHAELRRAVVDEHGTLVSLDPRTHKPDSRPVDVPDPARQVSLEREPTPLDTTPEHAPAPEDLQWWEDQLDGFDPGCGKDDDQDDDQGGDKGDDSVCDKAVDEALVTRLTSGLEDALKALLRRHLLVGTGGVTVEVAPWTHRPPPEGPDAGGPTPPPPPPPPPAPLRPDTGGVDPERQPTDPPESGADDPPEPPPAEPAPPTFDDLAWAEATVDRAAQDAQEPRPVYEREPVEPSGRPPTPARRTNSWTLAGLQAAHRRLVTTPVDRTPLETSAYALPPRLARHVKTRDVTCRFPGCRRLARDCDNDHVLPWPQGPSSPDNISSECKHHHLAKHAYFTVVRRPDGAVQWTSPLGRTYARAPRPLLRGW